MTRGQRVVLCVALAGGLAMGLFPPWRYTYHLKYNNLSDDSERPAGYAFIAREPEPLAHPMMAWRGEELKKLGAGVRIDCERLAIQYAVLSGATLIAFLALGARRGGHRAGSSGA